MHDATAAPPRPVRDAPSAVPGDAAEPGLHAVLKRHFGFDSFHPLQEEIIRDTLAARDVLALMPTGGGKSLCYQLPALVRPGLTVVVSPLIALMKDQVDALLGRGLPAALLNSALPPDRQREVVRGLDARRFRLLYVAPERLMQPAFLAALGRWDVALFAIDEAHCISEWGHDFRPEYRMMAELRKRFPGVPLMALTATATDRVRRDIAAQLGLREPGVYVASFNRPNLRYHVEPKQRPYEKLFAFLHKRREESGIVYCHTRRSTERLAERLRHDGFAAAAYHAGLEPDERARTQEQFLQDRVRVVCATVAFGMGVNKPNIRYVVHYDFPKNVESYYQETGRAGRDGAPADCLMLFGKDDAFNYERLIEEKTDARERAIARAQLEAMIRLAESHGCRRRELLAYFGETYPDSGCGACDNCLAARGSVPASAPGDRVRQAGRPPVEDRTEDARRFLACLEEIVRVGGFAVGVSHVCDVLRGSKGEKVTRFRHDRLSTYGSGRHVSKDEWSAIAAALLDAGCLEREGAERPVLRITPSGRRLLAGRGDIAILAPAAAAADDGSCDAALFERLRALRARLAEERKAPAYVIFPDASLRQMARHYPTTPDEMLRVSGVGQKKLADVAPLFMREIADYIREHGRLEPVAARDADAAPRPRAGASALETLERFRNGEQPAAIAEARGLALSTVFGHLAAAAEAGEEVPVGRLIGEEGAREIDAAFERLGTANLTGVREMLGERYEYGLLRLYRAVRGALRQTDRVAG